MLNKVLLVSIFILQVLSSFSQQTTVYVSIPRKFKVADQYYESSVGGLGNFMSVLQIENSDLYNKLQPEYQRIKTKRNIALGVSIPCYVIGGGLMIGSIVKLTNTDTDSSEPVTIGSSAYIGIGLITAGLISRWLLSPNRDDIFAFMNLHNKFSPEKKMEWLIGYCPTPNVPLNIGMSIRLKSRYNNIYN